MEIKVNSELKYLVDSIDGKENIPDEEVYIQDNQPEDGKIWIDTGELSNLGTEVVDSLEGNQINKAPSVKAVNDKINYTIITTGDFNDLMPVSPNEPCHYFIQATNMTNQPVANWGWLYSYRATANGNGTQVFVTDYIKNIYIRNVIPNRDGWSSWSSISSNYSTDEELIGMWKGKLLYRKIVDLGELPGHSVTKDYPTGLSNVNVKRIETYFDTFSSNIEDNNYCFPIDHVNNKNTSNPSSYESILAYSINYGSLIRVENTNVTVKLHAWSILEYTKR